MKSAQGITGYSKVLAKKALIIGEEPSVCELVSLILGDLGFKSIRISQSAWMPETIVNQSPDLIVWYLCHEVKQTRSQILSEIKRYVSMHKSKIMFLGGPEDQKDLELLKGDVNIHFCLVPFSPNRFIYKFNQLYGVGD